VQGTKSLLTFGNWPVTKDIKRTAEKMLFVLSNQNDRHIQNGLETVNPVRTDATFCTFSCVWHIFTVTKSHLSSCNTMRCFVSTNHLAVVNSKQPGSAQNLGIADVLQQGKKEEHTSKLILALQKSLSLLARPGLSKHESDVAKRLKQMAETELNAAHSTNMFEKCRIIQKLCKRQLAGN